MFKPGDQASYKGLIVLVSTYPMDERRPHEVSAPQIGSHGYPISDLPLYGVQRPNEGHIWLAHEEDLAPIPDGDDLAVLAWTAKYPPKEEPCP